MIKKLREEKCPSDIYNFISKWLKPRETSFIINSQLVENGKVYRDFPHKRMKNLVQVVQISDEVVIYVQSGDKVENKINLEVAVYKVAKNLSTLNLDLAKKQK